MSPCTQIIQIFWNAHIYETFYHFVFLTLNVNHLICFDPTLESLDSNEGIEIFQEWSCKNKIYGEILKRGYQTSVSDKKFF